MAYVDVYIDPADHIDELSTKELMEELDRRAKNGDPEAREPEWRDWDRLADFIAEGRTREALYILSSLAPTRIVPNTTLFFAEARNH